LDAYRDSRGKFQSAIHGAGRFTITLTSHEHGTLLVTRNTSDIDALPKMEIYNIYIYISYGAFHTTLPHQEQGFNKGFLHFFLAPVFSKKGL